MRLRTVSIAGVLLLMISLAVCQLLASELVLTRGFQDIEDHHTRSHATMAKDILNRQLFVLDDLAQD